MNKEELHGSNVLMSIINKCVNLIKERYGKNVDIYSLPLDDLQVYELIRSDRTCDVFGLESTMYHMRIEEKNPGKFSDFEELDVIDAFETYVCFWLKVYYPAEYKDALKPTIIWNISEQWKQ